MNLQFLQTYCEKWFGSPNDCNCDTICQKEIEKIELKVGDVYGLVLKHTLRLKLCYAKLATHWNRLSN